MSDLNNARLKDAINKVIMEKEAEGEAYGTEEDFLDDTDIERMKNKGNFCGEKMMSQTYKMKRMGNCQLGRRVEVYIFGLGRQKIERGQFWSTPWFCVFCGFCIGLCMSSHRLSSVVGWASYRL
ncbi:hypothetical protein ACHQM5_002194 [Ranunculus cassubicifolius]